MAVGSFVYYNGNIDKSSKTTPREFSNEEEIFPEYYANTLFNRPSVDTSDSKNDSSSEYSSSSDDMNIGLIKR